MQRTIRRLFLVCGCFLRQVLGVCSISIFEKIMGDPYYEPTIVAHDMVVGLNFIYMKILNEISMVGVV